MTAPVRYQGEPYKRDSLMNKTSADDPLGLSLDTATDQVCLLSCP